MIFLQKNKFLLTISASIFLLVGVFSHAQAQEQTNPENLKTLDTDSDKLSDYDEIYIYHTRAESADTVGDGYSDGGEVRNNYDPNNSVNDKLEKKIRISLADQSLAYGLGDYIQNSFKISSGLPRTPTPPGEYEVLVKRPVVNYFGLNYRYPNTKWNLMFKRGKSLNYYIHGAYWHDDFGKPKSHGCINVSYSNMEGLYNWADDGTRIIIK